MLTVEAPLDGAFVFQAHLEDRARRISLRSALSSVMLKLREYMFDANKSFQIKSLR